ncbi:MAG TPA: cysteine desulfurase [Alphaproteobacteria bacterium]|nr:cysteine desulfurase [Alphaproteobacteria bacterium]
MKPQHANDQDGYANDIDWQQIRADFPILQRQIHGKPLTYLDSAASAQKPQMVIDAISDAYSQHYANVHRGIHRLSEEATDKYESCRTKLAQFINAASAHEVVLTAGATVSLNIIAQSYGGMVLNEGDEVLISIADHHANIVPWQMICQQKGAILRAAPVEPDGHVDMNKVADMVSHKTKIIAMPHVSNVLGTVYDIKSLSDLAHAHDAVMVVDGCQGAVHMPVDIQALGCDFYVFSAHKLYGPSGIGMMWGRHDLLASMPPFMGGGAMIDRVTIEASTYADPPERFEAGTPPIAEALGFAAAIDYVEAIGMDHIRDHEHDLITYAHQKLSAIDGVKLIGTAGAKSGVISFVMDCAHPHDISTIVDRAGVAIRAGHHCAQPLHDFLDLPATARASVGIYNSRQDFDVLAEALEKVKVIFA